MLVPALKHKHIYVLLKPTFDYIPPHMTAILLVVDSTALPILIVVSWTQHAQTAGLVGCVSCRTPVSDSL